MNILIIEDDQMVIQLIEVLFRKNFPDHRITSVGNGQQALEMLVNATRTLGEPVPHLIILDINLPAINGLEVLKNVKSDDKMKSIPVIVVTSLLTEGSIVHSYRAGANSFLRKPFHPDEFIQAVKYWLTPPPLS